MNRNVIIRIPKGSSIRQKIRTIYTDLYILWKRAYPNSTSYTVSRLRQNIRNALSIHGRVFKEEQFSRSRYIKWGNSIVIFYSHFYWLVCFRKDRNGNIVADVIDACYEGDYHNDIMSTKPYGESVLRRLFMNIIKENKDNTMKTNKKVVRLTESDLYQIISESIKRVLTEGKVVNNKPFSQWSRELRTQGEFGNAWNEYAPKHRLRAKNHETDYLLDPNYSITKDKLYFIRQYGKFLTPDERKGRFTQETWNKIFDYEDYGIPDEQYHDYDADWDKYMYGHQDTFDDNRRPQGTLGTVHPEDYKNY